MAQVFGVSLLPRRCGFIPNLIIVGVFGGKIGFVTGFSCQNTFYSFSIIPHIIETHLFSYNRNYMILTLQSVVTELSHRSVTDK